MERVIQFHPDGRIEFTRTPELLALFEGEHKSIKRMSEILFDEAKQKYYIKMLLGPAFNTVFNEWDGEVPKFSAFGDAAYYDTYELAVADEIKMVDVFRRRGHSMHE